MGSNFSIDTMRAEEQDKKYMLCPAISGPNKAGRPKLDKRHTSLMNQAIEKKKKKYQAKDAKKQASSTVTEVGKWKKRKPDTETQNRTEQLRWSLEEAGCVCVLTCPPARGSRFQY